MCVVCHPVPASKCFMFTAGMCGGARCVPKCPNLSLPWKCGYVKVFPTCSKCRCVVVVCSQKGSKSVCVCGSVQESGHPIRHILRYFDYMSLTSEEREGTVGRRRECVQAEWYGGRERGEMVSMRISLTAIMQK